MATGDDLSAPLPRLKRNEDLLPEGEYVYIRHPETKVVHCLNHKVHIRRLLDAGGVRVAGPDAHDALQASVQGESVADLKAEILRLQAQLAEVNNASTTEHGTTNKPRAAAHS